MRSMAFSAVRSRAISNLRLPAIRISIWSPSWRPRASTTAAGRRTAKLFPHFATCIDIHADCISFGERIVLELDVFSLEIESDADGRDMLIADLWEQGSCGIAEPDGHCLRAFFEDCADRGALVARYPGAAIRIEEDRDWVRSARDLMQPMEVGARFFLVPAWRDDPPPPGRFR